MRNPLLRHVVAVRVFFLAAFTGNGPGPLKGTWQMGGLVHMTVTFRDAETQAMGMIEWASYEPAGDDRVACRFNSNVVVSALSHSRRIEEAA